MRILANYGHRTNGDSYNVTFETTGDVRMEHAEETIDELYRLAKEAVQRQIGDKKKEFPKGNKSVTIPKVTANGQGKNGDATDKQKNFLRKLAADKRKNINIDALNKEEASELIKDLIEV